MINIQKVAAALAISALLVPASLSAQQNRGGAQAGKPAAAAQQPDGKKVDATTAKGKVITVQGHVRGQDGLALPGASILESGTTTNFTLTNEKGDFTIKIREDSSFDVMFYGMQTQNVRVNGRSNITVTLREEMLAIEDAVVTGYGTIAKESYTGSAVTVTSSAIDGKAIGSVEEIIRSSVVGALGSASGQPGESGEIMLRGFGSLEGSNQPLYVIDGMVWDQESVSGSDAIASNPLASLNPSDIETFTVLKDAASASLYGSRGANGVIVITTKSGKNGEKMRIDIETTNGFATMTGRPEITTGREYADLWVEGRMHQLINNYIGTFATSNQRALLVEELKLLYGDKAGYTSSNGNNFYAWQKQARQDFNTKYMIPATNGGYNMYDFFGEDYSKLPNTSWYDEVTRVAPFTKNTIAVRGGFQSVNYYTSMEYFNQQGTVINSGLERYSMRMKFNKDKKNAFFNWGFNSYVAYTTMTGPQQGGLLYASPIYAANQLPSVVPARLDDGSYNLRFPDNLLNSNYNPLAGVEGYLNSRPQVNITIGGHARFKLTEWLKWNNQLSIYYYNFRRKSYSSSDWGGGYSAHGSLSERTVNRRRLTGKSSLMLNKSFRPGHNIEAVLVGEFEDLDYKVSDISAEYFGNDDLPYLSNSSRVTGYSGGGYANSMMSVVANGTYDYKKKYILGASFRQDRSSRFSPAHRVGNFWSVSGAYDIAKEPFMRRFRRQVTALKVKASYGINGSDNGAGRTNWRNLYGTTRYADNIGVYSSYRNREELTWEGSRIWNAGVDAAFFRNKLQITAEAYHRRSDNMLQNVYVSKASGYHTMLMNTDAGIDNKGLDFTAKWDVVSTNKYSVNLSANLSRLKSVYYGIQTQYLDGYSRQLIASGLPVTTWYLRDFAGVNKDTGQAMYYNRDENGDWYINSGTGSAPYRTNKQGAPKWFGSFKANLRYGRFELSSDFTYGFGHYVYDYLGALRIATNGSGVNYTIAASQLDRWTPDTPNGKNVLRINGGGVDSRSSVYLHKGDYLKVKNLKLTYRVHKHLYRKLGMDFARIYVQVDNLHTFSELKGYDPESSHHGYVRPDRSPTSRTVTTGIYMRF